MCYSSGINFYIQNRQLQHFSNVQGILFPCNQTMSHPTIPIAPAFANISIPGARQRYQHDRLLFHKFHSEIPITLFGVFDGHGSPANGHLVSAFCAENFLPYFLETPYCTSYDRQYLASSLEHVVAQLEFQARNHARDGNVFAGSTLCVAVLHDRHLVVVNIGDSRCIIGSDAGGNGKYTSRVKVQQVTIDHVCTDPREKLRVQRAGGRVIDGRLEGKLELSRSLGDYEYKDGRGLTAEAEIFKLDLKEETLFVILASDGLWGGSATNQGVGVKVEGMLLIEKDVEHIAKSLVAYAVEENSRDNISVVVGIVGKLGEREEESNRMKLRKIRNKLRRRDEEGRKLSSGGKASEEGGFRSKFRRRKWSNFSEMSAPSGNTTSSSDDSKAH